MVFCVTLKIAVPQLELLHFFQVVNYDPEANAG